MLSACHFTFPLAARTSVASDGIIKSTAPTHRAITQHHDMPVVGFHAVKKRCLSQIKSVPNHDLMPRNREHLPGRPGKTARPSATLQAAGEMTFVEPGGRHHLSIKAACQLPAPRDKSGIPVQVSFRGQ